MKGFSKNQLRKLIGKLDRARIQTREIDGRSVDYIEGWFAISEANIIFGYAGWDREMVHFEQVFARTSGDRTGCGYAARVRISVRAGETVVCREGTGFGQASANIPGDAHERALKAAETDATKRALATFGNRFGLSLYDKEQAGVGSGRGKVALPSIEEGGGGPLSASLNCFQLRTEDGTLLADQLSPEGFCSGLRQLVEVVSEVAAIGSLRTFNENEIARLRERAPTLKTQKGKHYAEILEALLDDRMRKLACTTVPKTDASNEEKVANSSQTTLGSPSRIAQGPAIDKSALTWASTRRIRNKGHLLRVGAKACLICEEAPCHAHHVTFAQPRGLSVKVSDEFTVPLCGQHHNELHRFGNEAVWWRRHQIDPLAVAERLWHESVTDLKSERSSGPGREN